MKLTRPSLGEFEHLVMIAVRNSEDGAYGLQIAKSLLEVYGGSLAVAQVYVTLQRLEEKGFLSSFLDSPKPIRGGRARRVFKLEDKGVQALDQSTAFLHALVKTSLLGKGSQDGNDTEGHGQQKGDRATGAEPAFA